MQPGKLRNNLYDAEHRHQCIVGVFIIFKKKKKKKRVTKLGLGLKLWEGLEVRHVLAGPTRRGNRLRKLKNDLRSLGTLGVREVP